MKGRKTRRTKTSRKSRRYNRSRRHRGGYMAPIGHTSVTGGFMAGPHAASLHQGGNFGKIHQHQHGGALYHGAPLSAVTGSVLSGPLVPSTGTAPLNQALSQINGMSDQTGGRRKKKGKRSRRRQRGGAVFQGGPYNASTMLGVDPSAAGLNKDWSAAENPNYWAPAKGV